MFISTFNQLTKKGMRYESILCNTKLRYGRLFEGSPEEQQDEALLLQEMPEEEIRLEKVQEYSTQEIYNPETKTIDLRRLKATNMRDNPRIGLP